jgi:hypothetical protein
LLDTLPRCCLPCQDRIRRSSQAPTRAPLPRRQTLPHPPPCLDRHHPPPKEPASSTPPSAPAPSHVQISNFLSKVSCGPFPALTIALLISAPGFDACVHTHGVSMNLCVVPVKVEGSDTATASHSGVLVCRGKVGVCVYYCRTYYKAVHVGGRG